jgi:hypothetical protein
MEIVTLREFARRVGVSLTAVQKGVQNGRIYADKDPKTGRISGIDYDTQAEAWVANAMHPQKRPHNIAGGRPREDGRPPAAPENRTQLKQPDDSPSPRSGMPLAEIQRARELVKLQLDNVKLKEAQGELVPATDVEKQGRQLASVIISSMYNIPDRISDELAGMSEPHDIHRLLLEEIDRAVQELRKTYA